MVWQGWELNSIALGFFIGFILFWLIPKSMRFEDNYNETKKKKEGAKG